MVFIDNRLDCQIILSIGLFIDIDCQILHRLEWTIDWIGLDWIGNFRKLSAKLTVTCLIQNCIQALLIRNTF